MTNCEKCGNPRQADPKQPDYRDDLPCATPGCGMAREHDKIIVSYFPMPTWFGGPSGVGAPSPTSVDYIRVQIEREDGLRFWAWIEKPIVARIVAVDGPTEG